MAERYGISEQSVWKWRGRDDVHDRSHTPHRLKTTLTPAGKRTDLDTKLDQILERLERIEKELATLKKERSE